MKNVLGISVLGQRNGRRDIYLGRWLRFSGIWGAEAFRSLWKIEEEGLVELHFWGIPGLIWEIPTSLNGQPRSGWIVWAQWLVSGLVHLSSYKGAWRQKEHLHGSVWVELRAHQIMSESCRCSTVQAEKLTIAYAPLIYACLQNGLEDSCKIISASFSKIMIYWIITCVGERQ